jgi:ketosteroid isomerase-like protein
MDVNGAARDSPEIRGAVDGIVAAFGAGRLDDYFSRFDPNATFVFYTAPERLESVKAYRALWSTWVAESGLRVTDCRTSDTMIQQAGKVAVVSHSVRTEIETNDGPETLLERETIVLERRSDGRWLGIHEHLSPASDD